MGIKQFFKNLILRMDMLSTQPILRTRGQSSFQTLCGGVFSFLIMIAFAAIFYSSFLNVVNKMEITYSQQFEDDPTSQADITSVQFAVGIQGVDLTLPLKSFVIELMQINMTAPGAPPAPSPIVLSLCNIADWRDMGKNFQKQFYGFGFDKMYCISPTQSASLYGYSGSFPYRFLSLKISICNGAIPGCDTTANVQASMATYLSVNNLYRVRLFIVDTTITASKNIPIAKMIQKNILLCFTSTTGSVGYAYIGDYTINTDQSILPYQNINTLSGSFLQTFSAITIPLTTGNTPFVQFQLYKSTKSKVITRSFGKIDTLLSYVGGLFSLLFTIIAFFFASYSQYSYEIFVGSSSLSLDNNGRRFNQNDFHFLTYLKYCAYDWLGAFGISPNWQSLKQISEICEETNHQLDPTLILKRLRYLQNMSHVLLSEHKQLCLFLSTPPTVEQSKKFRQMVSYYDKVITNIEKSKQAKKQACKTRKVANENIVNRNQQFDLNLNNSQNWKHSSQKQQTALKFDDSFSQQNQINKMVFSSLRQIKRQDCSEGLKIKNKILPQIFEMLASYPEESLMNVKQLKQIQKNGDMLEISVDKHDM